MKRALGLGLLSGLMALSVTPAFATTEMPKAATGTDSNPASLQIHKTFELPEGMTSVPAETFNFTVNQDSKNPEGTPDITVASIEYGTDEDNRTLSSKYDQTERKYKLTKDATVNLPAASAFPHAGEYVYTVTENNGAANGVSYSDTTYKLRVYVANGTSNNLYIRDVTASTPSGNTEQKHERIDFTNKFAKNSSLKISKKVAGALGDKTKSFTFTIKFTNKNAFGTTTGNGDIVATTTDTVKNGQTAYENLAIGTDYSFTLHDGQEVNFANIPVGTKYTVSEAADGDYKPSVVINSDTANEKEANKGETLSTGEQVIKEADTNTVAYTNTEDSITVTGVVINNLPYILLAGLGVIGCALLAVFKRRKLSK